MGPVTEGSSRGHEVAIHWNRSRVMAWLPAPLERQTFEVTTRTARRTEQAIAAARAGSEFSARFEPLATFFLRAEGVASSFIEGLRTPLAEVAAAEIGETSNATARLVADNLGAVVQALRHTRGDLRVDDIHSWHRHLLGASGLPTGMIGAFRDQQSWIGGTSPRDASFIPPPPDRVAPLMDDLVAFVNTERSDPVTQAAVVHAQFETIHPYGDGNGRVGRLLVGWLLARRLDLSLPPPVSIFIARDRGGYLSGMTMFRMGHLDAWVEWLAGAIVHSSESAREVAVRADELVETWTQRLVGLRADAAARKVLPFFSQHPVVSSELVAQLARVSERAARTALDVLAERGIVQRFDRAPTGSGRPRNYWVAGELLALVSGWPGA